MITQLISTLVHFSTTPLPPSSTDVIDGSPLSSGEIVHSSMYLVNNMAWLISHEYAIRMIFESYTVQLIKYCPTSVTDDRADPRSKNKMIQRIILNAFSIEGFICTGALPSTYSGYLVLHFICTLAISNVMCHALTIR